MDRYLLLGRSVLAASQWVNLTYYAVFTAFVVVFVMLIIRWFKLYKDDLVEAESMMVRSIINTRLLMIVAIAAYPFWGFIILSLEHGLVDPLWQRLVVAGIIALFLVATYTGRWFRSYLKQIVPALFYLMNLHICLLCFYNGLHPFYVVSLIIIMSTSILIFNTFRSITLYNTIILFVCTVITFYLDEVFMNEVLFLGLVLTIVMLSYVHFTFQRNLSDRLEFSDRIINSLNAVVLVANENGEMIFVGPSSKVILGYESKELLGNNWWKIPAISKFSPEERKHRIIELVKGISTDMSGSSYESCLLHKNGKPVWLRWTNTIVHGSMIFGVAQDVTELKEKEEQLELMSLLTSKTVNSIIITDKNNRIEWVNEGYTKINGWTLEEAKGKKPFDLSHGKNTDPDSTKRIAQKINSKQPFTDEVLIYNKDGNPFWVSVIVTPVLDDDGQVERYISLELDITDKKQSEERLSRYSGQLEMINKIQNAVIGAKEQNEVLYVVLENLTSYMPFCNRFTFSNFAMADQMVNIFEITSDNDKSLTHTMDIPLHNFGSYKYLLNKEWRVVNDVRELENPSPSDLALLQEGLTGYLTVPIHYGDQLVGSINLGTNKKDVFDDATIQLVRDIATTCAIAIEQLRLQDTMQSYNKLLVKKNQHITDSIKYAKAIQQAHLPVLSDFEEHFSDAFILSVPMEIVSGDFYWLTPVNGHLVMAVADCTGHGVPGGFLTMQGMSLLDNIVKSRGILEPELILKELHAAIRHSINKREEGLNVVDGMDIAICTFNIKERQLQFASALRPLYLFKGDRFIEDKGLYISLGNSDFDQNFDFHSRAYPLQQGDVVYLFSDGYADQFGGEKRKKFSTKRLRNLLTEIRGMPMKEQRAILIQHLLEWKRKNEQVDDVTVIGVRIP